MRYYSYTSQCTLNMHINVLHSKFVNQNIKRLNSVFIGQGLGLVFSSLGVLFKMKQKVHTEFQI